MPRVNVTPEHLQRAFERLRKADWPTFTEVMQDPVRSLVVRIGAARLASKSTPAAAAPAAAALPVPAPRQSAGFDFKRLAAGDRADD